MNQMTCSYCHPKHETVLWQDLQCRVLFVEDSPFTGWCRVVWSDHVTELSDLTAEQRNHIMHVVAMTEQGIRQWLAPTKMNLASLGTGLPHLHWHIIPRYKDDSHFPEPVWVNPLREGVKRSLPDDFLNNMKQHLFETI